MSFRSTLLVAVVAASLAVPSVSFSAPADRVLPDSDVRLHGRQGRVKQGVRCATSHVNHGLERVSPPARRSGALRTPGSAGPAVDIPVAVHVIYSSSKGAAVGNVSLARIEEQIDVLNAAYAHKGFSFHLASVDRTLNSKWFTGCYSRGTESAFKQVLAVDPATTLNLYTCQPSRSILGYAYYPSSYPEDSFWHGAVLHHDSLPGGAFDEYSEGDTGVHEVGHYLGLAHTFENGCSQTGDEVDDTPAEASPAYDCDATRDTCSSPGLDPIYNFMDYTPDTCMFEFTAGQTERMDEQVSTYRPSLGGGTGGCGDGICTSDEECSCDADCDTAATETNCTDGIDEDCDGKIDCADTNCAGKPACTTCGTAGSVCSSASDCCSGACKGKPSSRTCR